VLVPNLVKGSVDNSNEGREISYPAFQNGSSILLTVSSPLLGSGILSSTSSISLRQLYSFYSSGSKNLKSFSSILS
jgi:hypothetical protein